MIYAKNNLLPCNWGKGVIIAFLSIRVRTSRHVHPARGWGEGGDPQGSCQEVQVIVLQEETSSRRWVFSTILCSFYSVMSWASVRIQKMQINIIHCFVSAVTQTNTNVYFSLSNIGFTPSTCYPYMVKFWTFLNLITRRGFGPMLMQKEFVPVSM